MCNGQFAAELTPVWSSRRHEMRAAESACLLPVADDDGVRNNVIVSHDGMLAECGQTNLKIWLHHRGLILSLASSTRSISSRCSGAMAARRSSTDATASSLTCRWVCWCVPGGTPWTLGRRLWNTNGGGECFARRGSPKTPSPCHTLGRALKMPQQHRHRTMTTAVTTTKMSESFLSVTSEKCVAQRQESNEHPLLSCSFTGNRSSQCLGWDSGDSRKPGLANAFNEPVVDLGKALRRP